ncbi:MAG TPA: hypothetical protein VFP61_10310, partial [Acidimicrobiales bacterium]|nr:hypothetical protein [Acidimicrobiales bacterium]
MATDENPDHDHGHDHASHDHASHDHEHGHAHPGGVRGVLEALFRPHSHDAADSVDDALTASADGMRALAVSLGGL